MFSRFVIPIYYSDGRVGHIDEAGARMLANGLVKFAQLSPEDINRFKEGSDMAPRKKKTEATKQTLMLTEALTFVAAANRDNGMGAYQKHVMLADKMAVAYDGMISAGHPIEEEFNCCPHKGQLLTAIRKAGRNISLTELDGGARLSIRGDKLRVVVPCGSAEDLFNGVGPDPAVAPLDDRVKVALERVAVLASEAADNVVEAAVLLQANSAMATNRAVLLEAWHGVDLPPNMVVPKVFVQAIAKQVKPIVGFGCSWWQVNDEWRIKSVTFHYEGGAWIKTACYSDAYPNLYHLLNVQANYEAAPEGLFEAIDTIAEFNDNGWVTLAEGKVMSHQIEGVGAEYDVAALQGGKQFDGKLIRKIIPHAKTIDLTTYNDRMLFAGGEESTPVRGVVACIVAGGQV